MLLYILFLHILETLQCYYVSFSQLSFKEIKKSLKYFYICPHIFTIFHFLHFFVYIQALIFIFHVPVELTLVSLTLEILWKWISLALAYFKSIYIFVFKIIEKLISWN